MHLNHINDAHAAATRAAAEDAAAFFHTYGFVHVGLEPGDGTHYDIVVVAHTHPGRGGETLVATNLAPAYPWTPKWTDPAYATEKWGGPERSERWTGEVMAVFLSAFAMAYEALDS